MKFLDTNVFLRYLVEPTSEEDRLKHAACLRLFQDAQASRDHITTSESVIHEVLYVLCSSRQCGLTHADAAARLRPLLGIRSFRLPRKRLFTRALDLFAAHNFLDFADAMSIVHTQEAGHDLLSYDSDFDKVAGVTRSEP